MATPSDTIRSMGGQQEVDLSDAALTAADIKELSTAIAGHPSLTRLYLAGVGMDDTGAETLAQALRTTKAPLQELFLARNRLTDRGAQAIVEAAESNLPHIRTLALGKGVAGPAVQQRLATLLSVNSDKAPPAVPTQPPAVGGVTEGPDAVLYSDRLDPHSPHYYQSLLREQQRLFDRVRRQIEQQPGGPERQPGAPVAGTGALSPEEGSAVMAAVHSSGVAMLQLQMASEGADVNVFMSPISIFLALGMVLTGAAGRTLAGMRQALSLPPRGDCGDVLRAAGQLLQRAGEGEGQGVHGAPGAAAKAPPQPRPLQRQQQQKQAKAAQVEVAIANSLWGNKLDPAFVRQCRESYRAEARPLTTAEAVDEWVKEKTKGLIPQVLGPGYPLDPDGAVLVNAVYFKGDWTMPFEARLTQPNHRWRGKPGGGSHPHCTMMQRKDQYPYAKTQHYEAVELPYGEQGQYYAMVILPANESDPTSLAGPLLAQALATRLGRPQKGTVLLPKFRLDYSTSLKRACTALGMGAAFSDSAEFPGVSAVPLKISDVIHKTYVDVDEQGTEAAAVTAVVMVKATCVRPPSPSFRFVADRPFYFAILHAPTSALMFLGFIANPN